MRSQLLASCLGSAFCAALLLLTGCPKTSPTDGDGSAADGGSSTPVAGQSGGSGQNGGGSSGSSGGTDAGSGGGGNAHDAGSAIDTDASTSAQDAGSASSPSCESMTCEAYQHCELVQVTCIRAPCPPLPQCVDNASCGGIAGKACPGNGNCVDDPRDSCDPNAGGADCGGLCECKGGVLCAQGKVWDNVSCQCVTDPCTTVRCKAGTHCEASGAQASCVADASAGVTCGKNTCAVGELCCNESCGICAPPNGACIQIACL